MGLEEVNGLKGGMVWWWGEGENLFLRFLLGLFWGKCPARMTYHPNGYS